VLVLLACSVVVGFTDVTPVLAARIMGRARIVNLWVWPLMSTMSFIVYILIVAPLARGFVKDDRSALGRAFFVMVIVSIVGLIPYEGPQIVSPGRFEPFIDPVHPSVTGLAGELAPTSLTQAERINATYRFVRDNITYIDDPPIVGDYLQPPDETLERGYGDCEDVSILLVSLLRSEGFDASVDVIPGHARVALRWNGSIHVLDATSADEFQRGS
jgi:transglutaminase-like putative cysteine protease